MEKTLILIKPNAVQRGLIGEIIARIERKGLHITGLKMMQLDDTILNEHYAHLSERPFFRILKDSMMVTPVVAMCVEGLDAVETVRLMVGATNARKALPGTIRGDLSMSGEQNVVHASDSVENAQAEVKRFFSENEIFSYESAITAFEYGEEERAKM
jgi:nucleoside-diphosphate kinase